MGRTQHFLLCTVYLCVAALLPTFALADERPSDKPNTVFLPLTLQSPGSQSVTSSPLPPVPTAPPTPAPAPSIVELTTLEAEVIRLTNEARAKYSKCAALNVSPELTIAARAHSQDMADNNFFGSVGSDGSQPWDRIKAAGYAWMNAGENISAGSKTAQDVVNEWINDPKANIFKCEYKDIGVGFVDDTTDAYPSTSWPYRYYWTQDFGTKP